MTRSLLALVLAPLALVIACGGDDGADDGSLFQTYGGQGGEQANDRFERPDEEEHPFVGGSEGDAGSTANGKGGASSKGGTGGTGSAAKGGNGGKGGSGVAGSTQAGGDAGASSKGGAGGTGGATSKGGMGGASSKGGAAGTGGATSKGGTGGTGSSASKGGTGGAAGTSGSTSKGGSAGSPSPYEGSIVPTTCEQTHGSVGCCGPDNRAYYVEDDGSIAITTCTNGKVCGWRADKQWYGCVDVAYEDPTGTYPLTCGGAPVPGACEAATGGTGGAGGTGGTGGAGGASSGPAPGSEWTKCAYAWDCLSGLVCSAGYCQKPAGTGAGSNGGSSCQAKGGYGGLGCTGQFVLGCQQLGCGCCESGGVGQCCLRQTNARALRVRSGERVSRSGRAAYNFAS